MPSWLGADGAGVLATGSKGVLGHLLVADLTKNCKKSKLTRGQVGPVAQLASLASPERQRLPTLARSPGLIRLSMSSEMR